MGGKAKAIAAWRLIPLIVVLQVAFCHTSAANWLVDADVSLYHSIHDYRSSFLDYTMPWVSTVSDSEYEIVVAFALPYFGARRDASYTSIAATMGAEAITFTLKGLVNRHRPTGAHGRWNSSFPSGHVTSAYAMASVWGAAYPKAKLPLYMAAALIAYSRIYNGRHYPLDVLAGAGIGYLCGKFAWRCRNRIFPQARMEKESNF
ncbi:MAG: phosphatase PAP2 family protein [Candidatus Poribacteria bacterium]